MPECSFATERDAAGVTVLRDIYVKVLSCVQMARRLRGGHSQTSATSQAPQAAFNGMRVPGPRRGG